MWWVKNLKKKKKELSLKFTLDLLCFSVQALLDTIDPKGNTLPENMAINHRLCGKQDHSCL